MNTRVVIALDVDGVLAPDLRQGADPRALPKAGYKLHRYRGKDKDGNNGTFDVWLNTGHGPALLDLADRIGGELVWATAWNHEASRWIAPRLGLPVLTVVEVPGGPPRSGHSVKYQPVKSYIGKRFLVWLDDQFGPADYRWALERSAAGIPTCLIPVNPLLGLNPDTFETIKWSNVEQPFLGMSRSPSA